MAPAHLLIIEDDLDVARLLTAELKGGGFAVEWQGTAVLGLIAARERPPLAVILDLGLPDFDGRLVLSRLRATTDVPIVVLTARDTLADKLDVLELGASDYVVKPFQASELVARLHVQLRRVNVDVVMAGGLSVYPQQGQATLHGQALPLTRTELKVLTLLARHPGRVYTPQELRAAIWEGDGPVSGNLVRVHIGHLRRKLEAAGGAGLLRTVWRAGYALWPPRVA